MTDKELPIEAFPKPKGGAAWSPITGRWYGYDGQPII